MIGNSSIEQAEETGPSREGKVRVIDSKFFTLTFLSTIRPAVLQPLPSCTLTMNKGTRESNKNFKGGELHTKYNKRSTADVQAEKAAIAAEKAQKAKSKAQGAQRAAQLEHDARQKAAAQRSKPGSVYSRTPSIHKKEQKRPRPEESQG